MRKKWQNVQIRYKSLVFRRTTKHFKMYSKFLGGSPYETLPVRYEFMEKTTTNTVSEWMSGSFGSHAKCTIKNNAKEN